MSLTSFVRSLEPIYERRQIRDAIANVRTELEDFTQPVLTDFAEFYRNRLVRSDTAKLFKRKLTGSVSYRDSQWAAVLQETLDTLRKDLNVVDDIVRSDFSGTVASSDISFNRANVLRFIELSGFYVRYARKLILAIIGEESRFVARATPFHISQGEAEIVTLGMDSFVRFTAMVLRSKQNFGQVMRSISDASMTTNELEVVTSALGIAKTDPFSLSSYNKQFNPLLSLGKAFAEWQVKKFQAAKEERTSLQLRLQELRELEQESGGEPNPKLQQFIVHTEKRIEGLDYSIGKFEEETRLE